MNSGDLHDHKAESFSSKIEVNRGKLEINISDQVI